MNGEKKINIVLAGQGNSGKSTVFNYLTGLHQHIGNWAGKTIEKLEGTLFYKEYTIDVLDLPGIYSLTTYSVEEKISREYILSQKPDFVINIIDSTNLERNLIFTLQLLELECPIILVLNMVDLAKKKGVTIDSHKLQDILNLPVLRTVASSGFGLTDLIDKAIELKGQDNQALPPKYGKEIENCYFRIMRQSQGTDLPYPERWTAIKLLENDGDVTGKVREMRPEVLEKSEKLSKNLEEIHGHDSSIVIADERSHLASRITREIVNMLPDRKLSLNDRLDAITTHKITGYLLMILILGGMFLTVFIFGNWFSGRLELIFRNWHDWWTMNVGVTSWLLSHGQQLKVSLPLFRSRFPISCHSI